MEGVDFIETLRVGSGEHINNKYMFVTINNITRIKCH